MSLPDFLTSLKRRGRIFAWNHNIVDNFWFNTIRRNLPDLESRKPDFWIAGFPRSGNTFAGVLLETLELCPYVCYHLHHPPQLLGLIRSGIPGFIAMRDPLSTVVSCCIFAQKPPLDVFGNFIDFHRWLLPSASLTTVIKFEWFTTKPASLVAAAAAKCGVPPPISEIDSKLLKSVNERIDQLFIRDGKLATNIVARPHPARSDQQTKLRAEIANSRQLSFLLDEAAAVQMLFMKSASKIWGNEPSQDSGKP